MTVKKIFMGMGTIESERIAVHRRAVCVLQPPCSEGCAVLTTDLPWGDGRDKQRCWRRESWECGMTTEKSLTVNV